MLARSRLYQNLTPGERAILRLMELLFISALIAGVQATMPLLNGADPSAIPWPAALHTFLSGAVVSAGSSLLKYGKAFGDPPLPNPPAAVDSSSAPLLSAGAAVPQTLAELASVLVAATPSVNEPAGGGAEPVADASPPPAPPPEPSAASA